MYQATLPPEEATLTAGMVIGRRREFTAGRAAARAALAQLNGPVAPILLDRRRVPLWPAGYVGSITHCPGYTGAAVVRCTDASALGVDVEVAEPLPAELVADICSDAELLRGARPALLPEWLWPRLVFSAKECVFKCCFPVARLELDFQEVRISIGNEAGAFYAEVPEELASRLGSGRKLSGRYLITNGFIATGMVIPAR